MAECSHLIEEVDKLWLGDFASQLATLCHSQEDAFNLLGSLLTDQ
jgi:hypothetical protein